MITQNPFHWNDPKSWPWILYFWLAATAAGFLPRIWRSVQRKRIANWPITEGKIESAEVVEPKRSFWSNNQSPQFVAEFRFTYPVDADYPGRYVRNFPTADEAQEFVRDLKGRSVTVSYNPEKPSAYAITNSAIEALLQQRAPKPSAELIPGGASLPGWSAPILGFFAILAAVGLLLSLWVHINALLGHPPGMIFMALHVGIFIVWFPAVIVSNKIAGGTKRQNSWKIALRGAPSWMRYMVFGFFIYAGVNFFIFMTTIPSGHQHSQQPPGVVLRGFSGHWMAFYSAALAMLYSAAQIAGSGARCSNGHPMPPGTDVCPQCGASAQSI